MIDPLAVEDITPFWNVVLDSEIEVVMHAAGEDLRICRLQTGELPPHVIDVQLAAALVGYGYPISLGNLVRQELGIQLAGGETRTDWRRRPLSPAQLRYALDDVRHLLDLADRFGAQMAERNRLDWAQAEYQSQTAAISRRAEEDRWRRLPGLHQLNRRGLETARLLYAWRLEHARSTNQPLRRLMRDDLLVGIAKRQPSSRRDLEALRDFNRPHLLARSREILDIIAEAQLVPPENLPEHAERHDDGPGMSMVVSLLAATLNQCCAQHQIAASLVGSTADLKDLIRWHVEGQPAERQPSLLQDWRGEVCGHTLLDVLSGRRALRVVDPTAEVPVALDPIDED